jgi:hypothetical protein
MDCIATISRAWSASTSIVILIIGAFAERRSYNTSSSEFRCGILSNLSDSQSRLQNDWTYIVNNEPYFWKILEMRKDLISCFHLSFSR